MVTFISRIAQELIDGPGVLHEKLVLLPNQRAELFLREALKEHFQTRHSCQCLPQSISSLRKRPT